MFGKKPLKISASLLAANHASLGSEVKRAAAAGCDEIHADIMDGRFAPNLSFGPDTIAAIREHSNLTIDAHMMVCEPLKFVERFAKAGADIYTVHAESSQPAEALESARMAGMKPCLAVSPNTPASAVFKILKNVGRVVVMTVLPGFSGQSFMREMLPKIEEITEWASARDIEMEICIDGGVNSRSSPLAVSAGAHILVSGAFLFGSRSMVEAVSELRRSSAVNIGTQPEGYPK